MYLQELEKVGITKDGYLKWSVSKYLSSFFTNYIFTLILFISLLKQLLFIFYFSKTMLK